MTRTVSSVLSNQVLIRVLANIDISLGPRCSSNGIGQKFQVDLIKGN